MDDDSDRQEHDVLRPVAWCPLGTREKFPRLERSSMLAAADDEPVVVIDVG